MRLIYAGTPDFAVPALDALADAGHDIVLVLSQPDRPAGRGMQLAAGPVKQCALRRELKVYQPSSLNTAEDLAPLIAAEAEAIVVAAYGIILPQAALDVFPRGAYNIHASLLPRWRGAAPIQRAILAGDERSGVCIMQMEAGLDTGPVLLREAVDIAADQTAGGLETVLASLGADMIVRTLAERDRLTPEPQSSSGATYAAKVRKSEARIDWRQSASQIERQIRAFNPAPGASARIGDVELKIWAAEAVGWEEEDLPGRILSVQESAVVVACGEDALWLKRLQRPGGKPLDTREFLRGFKLDVDAIFLCPGD